MASLQLLQCLHIVINHFSISPHVMIEMIHGCQFPRLILGFTLSGDAAVVIDPGENFCVPDEGVFGFEDPLENALSET